MIYSTDYRVIYGDTDKAGVVYYGNYLRLFEIGRTEFLRKLADISYKGIEEKGFVLPVTEAYIRYKVPAFYDDLLVIETALSGLEPYSVTFFYRILRKEDQRVVVQGSTKLACVNAKTGKVSRIPEEIYHILEPLVLKAQEPSGP